MNRMTAGQRRASNEGRASGRAGTPAWKALNEFCEVSRTDLEVFAFIDAYRYALSFERAKS